MKNALVAAALMSSAWSSLATAQWTPPLGIPMPPFGIEESHQAYAGQSGYRDAGDGPYTHYVNNEASNCTSSGAGTEEQPSCTIPTVLSAGDVVEVHGGPYVLKNGKPVYTLNGSESRPAFLRGVDDGSGYPIIEHDDRLDLAGSYFVVEGLVFDGASVRNPDNDSGGGASYAALRNLEIRNSSDKNGSVLSGDNIVLIDSHVHHNQGDDRHGTNVEAGSENIWIVDSYFHHNGGDAIQFCHGCESNPPSNVYIGRNTMHSDRENAVDLKYAENVVISENVISAYREAEPDQQWCFDDGSSCGVFSSGSDGAGIVIGSDGGPRNIWILSNDVSDSHTGIRIEEGYEVWILGNLIHEIGGTGRAIALDKDGLPLHIAHNVISAARYGIDQNWRESFALTIDNNIFHEVSSAAIRLESRSVAESATLRNNVFWNGGGNIPLVWIQPGSASSAAQLDQFTGGSGNVVADPQFINVAAQNFRVLASSPAVDAGTAQLAEYDETFRGLFPSAGGLLRDVEGKIRPVDGDGDGEQVYDIGAYEHLGLAPPLPPTALLVE